MFIFMKRILSFTVLFSSGQSYYHCNRTGNTLEQAISNCGDANGRLLTAANLKEMDLLELFRANVTEFWISNIIKVAHAVEYKGCYVYSQSQSQSNPDSLGGINLVDCQKVCDNNNNIYPLYGLYGNNCVCINRNESHFNLSNQSCFDNCSIDTLEFCKVTKLIALYKKIRNENKILQINNLVKNKCIVRINTTSSSTENCQKNLQYRCNGSTQNGTFLNALENCGKELDRDHTSVLSWRPMFFPTIDGIEDLKDSKQKKLKMTICQSFKVEKNLTRMKERNCTDSLPYICKTEGQETNTAYSKSCLSQNWQTASFSINTNISSTGSSIHSSTMPDTSVDARDTRSVINYALTKAYKGDSTLQSSTTNIDYASKFSYIRDTTIQSSTPTESVATGMSKKPLIIGIASAAATIILAVISIFIVRKRLKRTKTKTKNDLHTVNFQAVANETEEQAILNHQNEESYSLAVSVNVMTESNQRNDVYAVVNKNKHADNRTEEFYSLASPVSSTSVQSKQKEGSGDIYAVVKKNKKETENEEPQNNTEYNSNIDGSKIITGSDDNLFMHTGYYDNNTIVESERKPGNCVTYPLSSGTDYDHIDFRGSGNTDELPGATGPLYDHAAVGENSAGLIYDVRRDVEQHGTDDTYDHALSL